MVAAGWYNQVEPSFGHKRPVQIDLDTDRVWLMTAQTNTNCGDFDPNQLDGNWLDFNVPTKRPKYSYTAVPGNMKTRAGNKHLRRLGLTYSRVGWGPRIFFSTHGNQLPSLSGVHGLKDLLCSDHLVESFYGRSYSLKHSHKCNFYHQTTQQDGH